MKYICTYISVGAHCGSFMYLSSTYIWGLQCMNITYFALFGALGYWYVIKI